MKGVVVGREGVRVRVRVGVEPEAVVVGAGVLWYQNIEVVPGHLTCDDP